MLNSYSLSAILKDQNSLAKIVLIKSTNEESVMSLNVRSASIGSHLFKVDLSCLETLKENMSKDTEIDFESVKGLLVEPICFA